MDKKIYITPTTKWVWIGMDEKLSTDVGGGVVGSGVNNGNLPDDPWGGGTKEEEIWTEDSWNSASGGGVWDKAW